MGVHALQAPHASLAYAQIHIAQPYQILPAQLYSRQMKDASVNLILNAPRAYVAQIIFVNLMNPNAHLISHNKRMDAIVMPMINVVQVFAKITIFVEGSPLDALTLLVY